MQAQYEMGLKYREAARSGWEVDDTYLDEATLWFEMAASQGDARAQYYLAGHYFGINDNRESLRLLQMAAQQGMAEAQYSLGVHYAQAWGTEQNLVLAYKWIALANEGGTKGGSLMDTEWLIWKGKLSAEQIAEGKRLAAEHSQAYGKSQPLLSVH